MSIRDVQPVYIGVHPDVYKTSVVFLINGNVHVYVLYVKATLSEQEAAERTVVKINRFFRNPPPLTGDPDWRPDFKAAIYIGSNRIYDSPFLAMVIGAVLGTQTYDWVKGVYLWKEKEIKVFPELSAQIYTQKGWEYITIGGKQGYVIPEAVLKNQILVEQMGWQYVGDAMGLAMMAQETY